MNKSILILLLPVVCLITGCSGTKLKEEDKGKLIFLAEYDGVIGTDNLYLYEKGVFEIYLPDLTGNGTFKVKKDTIFLNYFEVEDNQALAFIIENGSIFELKQKNKKWIRNEQDTSMGIYKNLLND